LIAYVCIVMLVMGVWVLTYTLPWADSIILNFSGQIGTTLINQTHTVDNFLKSKDPWPLHHSINPIMILHLFCSCIFYTYFDEIIILGKKTGNLKTLVWPPHKNKKSIFGAFVFLFFAVICLDCYSK